MADVRWQENRAGIAALLRSPAVAKALQARAETAKSRAEQIAPVDTGRYKASFYTQSGTRPEGAYARLGNNVRSPQGAPYGIYLEFGTRYMRRQRILGRVIDSMANLP